MLYLHFTWSVNTRYEYFSVIEVGYFYRKRGETVPSNNALHRTTSELGFADARAAGE